MKLLRLTLLLTLVCLTSTASAEIRVSLPLQGYYRVGHYMPVAIEGGSGDITIGADGAVTVTVTGVHTPRATALLLVLDRLGPVHYALAGAPPLTLNQTLTPLTDDDRLVICAPGAIGTARRLFPGRNVIGLDLAGGNPLRAVFDFWESVDAIIFEHGEVFPSDVPLLSLPWEITLAVPSAQRPDGRWPWVRMDDYWVLHHELAGPRTSLVGEQIYLPTSAWRPGTPDGLRRSVVIGSIIMSILILGITLLRRKKAIWGVVTLAVVASGFFAWWQYITPTLHQVGGIVAVIDGPFVQFDEWTYEASSLEAELSTGLGNRPMFISPQQAAQLKLSATSPDGTGTEFGYRLQRGQRIALLSRRIERASDRQILPAVASPMESVARALYMRPGDRIVGSFGALGLDQWPSVVIERSKKE
jgi:hypothetical protein